MIKLIETQCSGERIELCSYRLTYYKDVESREIQWLWYPYIPSGKITIVEVDPGEGKATFVLSLLAILSNNEPLPCSNTIASGQSIYQNTEDDNADTIKPRLERHGANCSNICFIDKKHGSLSIDEDELEKAVVEAHAKILVLDPIQAFIGENIDMNRANVIRPRMNRLKEIAETTGCAILLVGHLNKNASGKATYRGLGSIDFSAAARSVLVVGRPSCNPYLRVVAQQKNNLGPIGKSLAFTLNNRKVEWIGEYDISASELLSSTGSAKEIPKSVAANILLSDLLSNGEKSYREIMQIASDEGIGKRTLMEAKAALNITSTKHHDGWYWSKPR